MSGTSKTVSYDFYFLGVEQHKDRKTLVFDACFLVLSGTRFFPPNLTLSYM